MVDDASAVVGHPAVPMGTGRLGFELFNERGWSVGGGEFVLRPATVTVWFDGRALAVMGRDSLEEWLFHPDVPFEVDDVVWSSENGVTRLAFAGRRPCSVAKAAVNTLRMVI